ncbi:MAG: hypothetical protein ACP5K2_06375 [bacterium]
MVTTIPEGVYTMKGKMSIIIHNAYNYCKGSKKQKTNILNELTEILHMNRKYLSCLLRNAGKTFYVNGKTRIIVDPSLSPISQRGRKKVYTKEITRSLLELWRISRYVSSKHQ